MRWNKLKAFTITELLVVMLITSILVVIIGAVFINMEQYRGLLERKSAPIKQVTRLQYLIDSDQQDSQEIRISEDSLIFVLDSIRIRYLVGKKNIFRQQLHLLDSFPFAGEITNITKEEGLVTGAKILLEGHDLRNPIKFRIQISKQYSSSQLFNLVEDEYQGTEQE